MKSVSDGLCRWNLVREDMGDDILQLIQGCLAGNESDWERVRSISLKFLRSRKSSQTDDHADIMQEVIIKLLQGFRRFNGTTETELNQYITVTTMREAVSFYRRNSRHQSHDSFDQTPDDSENTLHSVLPDKRFAPDMIAELNDLYRRATETLSVRDRQILLYKIEGFKDNEIADILGMKAGGVAVTYNRIKELLRRTLLLVLLIILFGRKLSWMASL
jgi:RNA polymerase sigma factor (sigma-70 family)